MERYIITNYGAKADYTELQTEKIQALFDLCKQNGGTVVIPKGRFYTAALRMWSNMSLYLKRGVHARRKCQHVLIVE